MHAVGICHFCSSHLQPQLNDVAFKNKNFIYNINQTNSTIRHKDGSFICF